MPFGHLLTGNQALMDSEYPKVQTEFFSACEWGTRPPERPRENGKIMTSHLIETYSVHFQTTHFVSLVFLNMVSSSNFFVGKTMPIPHITYRWYVCHSQIDKLVVYGIALPTSYRNPPLVGAALRPWQSRLRSKSV